MSKCILWQGAVDNGYGTTYQDGKTQRPHRLAYIKKYGSIPDGLVIDHLCRVKLCINPEHLEAVTNKENVLRGVGPSAINKRKTHCSAGHEFNKKNTHIDKANKRKCRVCNRIRVSNSK